MCIKNEQSLISTQKNTNAFSVNRRLVNSKQYRDKFECLPLSSVCKSRVYSETGRLLNFVDGQENEYMTALDYYSGEHIIDNFNRNAETGKTGFSEDEYNTIEKADTDIVIIHNHSYNGIPSARDILTFYKEPKIKLSLIACHTGELYGIFKVSSDMPLVYNDLLEEEKKVVNNMSVAKRLATTRIYSINDKLSQKRKLFDVRRL